MTNYDIFLVIIGCVILLAGIKVLGWKIDNMYAPPRKKDDRQGQS